MPVMLNQSYYNQRSFNRLLKILEKPLAFTIMSLNEVRNCASRKNNNSNKNAELFFQILNLLSLKIKTKKKLRSACIYLQINALLLKNQSENEYTAISMIHTILENTNLREHNKHGSEKEC